ncbi:glutaminase kidney isoform, mitochondrial-like, partial [Seriola lalandi dorsalis]|uniref:glutaminase kidney isoform, mitochondrial-like n=1 Tax=Seriola lalandi dorsalis TaxID=1841481 RepID=UPI000C6FAB41
MSGGQVADYIPQLARFSPDLWAVALCTVDGQRHTVGDTKVPFCLQSCVKPLKYAIAVHDHGTEYVHRFIGKEPSGLRFNKLFLNEDGEESVAAYPIAPPLLILTKLSGFSLIL